MRRLISLFLALSLLLGSLVTPVNAEEKLFANIKGSSVESGYDLGQTIHIIWEGNDTEYYYLLENDETHQKVFEGTTKNNYLKWTAENDSPDSVRYEFRVKPVNGTWPDATGDDESFYIDGWNVVDDVDIDQGDLTLEVGESIQLSASVFPSTVVDDDLTWYSKDPDKVSCTPSGKITALEPYDRASIYAEAENGKKDSIDVEVVSAEVVVERITFPKSTYYILVGETINVEPVITPSDAVNADELEWSTRSDSITVVDGKITGTAVDSSSSVHVYSSNGIHGEFDVVVEANPDVLSEIREISIVGKTSGLVVGDTVELTYSIDPYERLRDCTVDWESSNTNVAKVNSNGELTAVGGGNATITAYTEGVTDSLAVSVEGYWIDFDIDIKTYDSYEKVEIDWDSSLEEFEIYFRNKTTGETLDRGTTASDDYSWKSSDFNVGDEIFFEVGAINADGNVVSEEDYTYFVPDLSKDYSVEFTDHAASVDYKEKVRFKWDGNGEEYVLHLENTTFDYTMEFDPKYNYYDLIFDHKETSVYKITIYAIDDNGKVAASDKVTVSQQGEKSKFYVEIGAMKSSFSKGEDVNLTWGGNCDEYHLETTYGSKTIESWVDERVYTYGTKTLSDTFYDCKTIITGYVDGVAVASDYVMYDLIKTDDYEIDISDIKEVYNAGDSIRVEWKSNLDSFNVYFINRKTDEVTGPTKTSRKYWNIDTSGTYETTTYRFRVVGLDSSGNEVIGAWREFEVVANNNEYLLIDDIQNNYDAGDKIYINWTGSTDDYRIRLKNIDNNTVIREDEITSQSFTVTTGSEKKTTNYSFTVEALDRNSDVVYTDTKTFTVNVLNKVSEWAQEHVDNIAKEELITKALLDEMIAAPQDTLTRAEFCVMLVELYEAYDRKNTPAIKYDRNNAKDFRDIGHLNKDTQEAILKANAIQIVNGTSDTTFAPDVEVTREMLATMLRSTYYAMYGYGIEMSRGEWRTDFNDLIEMSEWAVDGIRFSNALEILNGDGYNFSPKATATHEQGLTLISRANSIFLDFNEEVDFRIEASNSIKNYTDLRLECYYDNLLIGDVHNNYVDWSSSNNSIAGVTSGPRLTAYGKGDTMVTAKYGGIEVASEKFTADKQMAYGGNENEKADTLTDITLYPLQSEIFAPDYLDSFVSNLRPVREAEYDNNIVEGTARFVLNFGEMGADEMKEYFIGYAANSVDMDTVGDALGSFKYVTDKIPELTKVAELDDSEYRTIVNILEGDRFKSIDSFTDLTDYQKVELSSSLNEYLLFAESSINKQMVSKNDEKLMILLDQIYNKDSGLVAKDKLNKMVSINSDTSAIKSADPKLIGAVNVVDKLGDAVDWAVVGWDAIQEFNKLDAITTESVTYLENLKDVLPEDMENYDEVVDAIDGAIFEINNKYAAVFSDTTLKSAKIILEGKLYTNPYIAWFKTSQSITTGLTGDFTNLNYSVREQVVILKGTKDALKTKYSEYINNPSKETLNEFLRVLELFIDVAYSAIDLDIESEQGGLLYYGASGIYYLAEGQTLTDKWKEKRETERAKLKIYEEYLNVALMNI